MLRCGNCYCLHEKLLTYIQLSHFAKLFRNCLNTKSNDYEMKRQRKLLSEQ